MLIRSQISTISIYLLFILINLVRSTAPLKACEKSLICAISPVISKQTVQLGGFCPLVLYSAGKSSQCLQNEGNEKEKEDKDSCWNLDLNLDLYDSLRLYFSQLFHPFKNIQNYNGNESGVERTRLSSLHIQTRFLAHCESHIFPQHEFNQDHKGSWFDREFREEFPLSQNLYLFVGSQKRALESFFERKEISALKYKMGIFLNCDWKRKEEHEHEAQVLAEDSLSFSSMFWITAATQNSGKILQHFDFKRRNNLAHKKLRVSVYIVPSVYTKNSETGDILGLSNDMIKSAGKMYNFSVTFFRASSNLKQHKNGSWPGALGLLHQRESDVYFYIGVSIHRHGFFSYGTWVTDCNLNFYTRAPRPLDVNWRAYARAFSNDLWLAILGSMCAIFIYLQLTFFYLYFYMVNQGVQHNTIEKNSGMENVLTKTGSKTFLLEKLITCDQNQNHDQENGHGRGQKGSSLKFGLTVGRIVFENFYTAFNTVAAPLLSQPMQMRRLPACHEHDLTRSNSWASNNELKGFSISGRMLIGIWLMVTVVISNFYCSDLLAAMTVLSLDKIPRDFPSLSQRDDYEIQMVHVPGAAGDLFLQNSKDPVYINIRERMKQIPYKRMTYCIGAGISPTGPNRVCIAWDILVDPILATNFTLRSSSPRIFKSSQPMITLLTHPYLQKNSKYLDAINDIVGYTRDAGVGQKSLDTVQNYHMEVGLAWRKRKGREAESKQPNLDTNPNLNYETEGLYLQKSNDQPKSLNMKLFSTPLSILIFSLTLGLLILLGENLVAFFFTCTQSCPSVGNEKKSTRTAGKLWAIKVVNAARKLCF